MEAANAQELQMSIEYGCSARIGAITQGSERGVQLKKGTSRYKF